MRWWEVKLFFDQLALGFDDAIEKMSKYLRFAYAWLWWLLESPWIIFYWLITGGPPRPWKRRWP